MLALSVGLGEGGEGLATKVASVLPAVESGGCGGGEALEGAKRDEGGRNLVGREGRSDPSIRKYGMVNSCPVFGVKPPRVRKSTKGSRTGDEDGWVSLSLSSRSLPISR